MDGYIASARMLPLDGKSLDLKEINFNRFWRVKNVVVDGGGLLLKTLDVHSEAEARMILDDVVENLPCRIDYVSVSKVFPGPNVSYTYVYETHIDPKFVDAYIKRVRESGFQAKIYTRPSQTVVYLYMQIGLFPDLKTTYEQCNKIFVNSSFRYTQHGEYEPLPSFNGGGKKLADILFTPDDSFTLIDI